MTSFSGGPEEDDGLSSDPPESLLRPRLRPSEPILEEALLPLPPRANLEEDFGPGKRAGDSICWQILSQEYVLGHT